MNRLQVEGERNEVEVKRIDKVLCNSNSDMCCPKCPSGRL